MKSPLRSELRKGDFFTFSAKKIVKVLKFQWKSSIIDKRQEKAKFSITFFFERLDKSRRVCYNILVRNQGAARERRVYAFFGYSGKFPRKGE